MSRAFAAKTIPFGAAHTYIADMREYPPFFFRYNTIKDPNEIARVNCFKYSFKYSRDRVTDKRYLYPIRHSRSSQNYRKKGHLAQLVGESDLFFRVTERQIKTVLTNVVVEHMKSRMSINAKTRQR